MLDKKKVGKRQGETKVRQSKVEQCKAGKIKVG